MSNSMEYKKYVGSVEFSEGAGVFFGKVMGIRPLISYEGTTAKELVEAFHGAVDDYLELCAVEGKEPERACKKILNIRVSPNLHKQKVYSVSELKAAISPIAVQYGLARIFLFGSYARQSATKDSDIDLRIDKGSLKVLFELGALHCDLEEALGKKVDLLTTESLDQTFLSQIADEEIVLYDRLQSNL